MSWIVGPTPYAKPSPRCVVLCDPHSDKTCQKPADTGRTALELPICEDCFDAVRTIEGNKRVA